MQGAYYNNSNVVSVIITDSQRLIIWVNEQFSKMTGYTLSEVKGKKPSLLQGRNTELSAKERIRAALKREKPFHDRITNYRKNGEEYTCALSIHPVFNTQGILSNFVAMEVDNNFVDPNDVELMKISSTKKTGLTTTKELELYFKLNDFFRKEKPYLNPDISLNQVCNYLETNSNYLSQVINNQTGKNFRYFVNQFRVQEFQAIVSTSKMSNFTLYSIAQSCGFKNKSTFHNVILNHTGKTPKCIADNY